ncbi:MAG TPA: hypothetical protein DCL00_03220, partial [Opitutae bacterium]|nr:hypothetical protein [Opitutae bacterium]
MTKLKDPPAPFAQECPDPQLVEDLKESIVRQLRLNLARNSESASSQEVWTAVCLAVRERIMERYMKTQNAHVEKDA